MLNIQKKASSEFIEWIHDVLGDTLDKFSAYYNQEWDRLVIDEMAKIEGFKESYLSDLLADTASFAGTEIIRRIIGLAHVEDIVSLPKEQRLLAEKEALLIGKKLILESKTFKTGQDYLNLFK